MYNAEIKLKPSSEQPYFDQLIDVFIRPPRQLYKTSELGSNTFIVNKLLMFREDFSITSRQSTIKLECSLYTPRPVVIYLHGNSSSRMESNSLAGLLGEEQISLLNFDFGGCGISEGDYVSLGWYERDDLQNIIDHIREKRPLLTEIGIWGRSMGAVTALMSATNTTQFKAIVADTPFSSLKQLCLDLGEKKYNAPKLGIRFVFYMLRKKVRKLVKYDPKHLDIIKFVKQIPKNFTILFLRASDDNFIGKNHVEDLYQIFQGEKYISIFQGDHNTQRPKEIYQQIVRFFSNRLQNEKLKEKRKEELQQIVIKKHINAKKNSSDKKKNTQEVSSHTDDQFQQSLQDINQFEIAHEYDGNYEQIHKPIRGDEVSVKYQETEIIHNSPFSSDYEQINLANLQSKTTKRDKRDLESFDSERYIRVPSEINSKHVPQFKE